MDGAHAQPPPPGAPVQAAHERASALRAERLGFVERTLEFASRTLARIVDEPEHFVAICARQRADAETALDKLVAETALLALVARSAADPALIATLVAQLLRLARNERHRALILADPRAAAGLSFAHAALSRLGAPDPSFDRLLSPGLAHSATAVERPVFRAMEQRWISALLRGDSIAPDCANLLGRSLCFAPGSGFEWDVRTTYAFTHELFYLTGFGRFAAPAVLNRAVRAADEALAVQIGLNDLDLLGELLMARAVLDEPESPASLFADSLIVETWRDHGFLPGPQFEGGVFDALPSELKPHYAALAVYHTTFVGALYCVMRPGSSREAGERLEPTGSAAGRTIDWAAHLRRGEAPVLRRVIAAADAKAAPVLAEAALARALRLGPHAAIRDALRLRQQIGLAPSRLVELAANALGERGSRGLGP